MVKPITSVSPSPRTIVKQTDAHINDVILSRRKSRSKPKQHPYPKTALETLNRDKAALHEVKKQSDFSQIPNTIRKVNYHRKKLVVEKAEQDIMSVKFMRKHSPKKRRPGADYDLKELQKDKEALRKEKNISKNPKIAKLDKRLDYHIDKLKTEQPRIRKEKEMTLAEVKREFNKISPVIKEYIELPTKGKTSLPKKVSRGTVTREQAKLIKLYGQAGGWNPPKESTQKQRRLQKKIDGLYVRAIEFAKPYKSTHTRSVFIRGATPKTFINYTA